MTVSELRIGNWVAHDGFPFYIRDVEDLSDIERTLKHGTFTPIPLTEDWLRKFGFEDNSYAMFYKYVDNEFFITVSFKDYAHTQLSEHPVEVNDYSLPLNCKYVHQLQNLFHALTGEELTITEQ